MMPDFLGSARCCVRGRFFFAMNTGIEFTSTKGGSLHPLSANDYPATSPLLLFMAAGFEAVADWPLPCGRLPVTAKTLGRVSVTPAEWEEYRALCDAERPLLAV